jgi:hypothetical protein
MLLMANFDGEAGNFNMAKMPFLATWLSRVGDGKMGDDRMAR